MGCENMELIQVTQGKVHGLAFIVGYLCGKILAFIKSKFSSKCSQNSNSKPHPQPGQSTRTLPFYFTKTQAFDISIQLSYFLAAFCEKLSFPPCLYQLTHPPQFI